MASMINKSKPKITRILDPSNIFPMNSPNGLSSSFPVKSAFPIQTIKILKDTWGINNNIILSIINQDLNIPKCSNNITSIRSTDIISKWCINTIISWDEINFCTKDLFVVLQYFGEWFVKTIIVTEVEHGNSTEICVRSCVVVCYEVEIGCCLQINKYLRSCNLRYTCLSLRLFGTMCKHLWTCSQQLPLTINMNRRSLLDWLDQSNHRRYWCLQAWL